VFFCLPGVSARAYGANRPEQECSGTRMDRPFFTVGCEERVHHEFAQLAVLEDGPSARRRQDRSDTGGVCDLVVEERDARFLSRRRPTAARSLVPLPRASASWSNDSRAAALPVSLGGEPEGRGRAEARCRWCHRSVSAGRRPRARRARWLPVEAGCTPGRGFGRHVRGSSIAHYQRI
jgi:hypothetical protein